MHKLKDMYHYINKFPSAYRKCPVVVYVSGKHNAFYFDENKDDYSIIYHRRTKQNENG